MPARSHATPAALVEAAVASLLDLTVVDLVSAVGTRAIAARAGVSPASLFHHFGSTRALAKAVLLRVFDPRRPPPEVEIGTGISQISSSALPSGTSVAFHAGEFDRLVGDPEHALRVGLWALGGPAGRTAYGDYMRHRDAPLHDLATRLYDGWGRELRPPMSIPRFVAAQAALLSGSVIRGSVDPETVDRESFARSAASMSLVMLRSKGERRDLDDRLAEINYYPLVDRGTRVQHAARRLPQRERVVASARALFWERGLAETTMGDVARAAGLATSTVHSLFEGKGDLAVSCLQEDAREHLRSDVDWRRRLEDVAALLARSAHLSSPYAEELVRGDRLRPDDVLLTHVERALSDATTAGDLTDDVSVEELAHTLLTVLLARLLSHPAGGASGALRWAHRVVLDGLAPRAR